MSDHSITVNGREVTIPVAGSTPLVEVLRHELGLVGTRQGCGLEQCGACRVLLDGKPVYACTLTLAESAGHVIESIESHAPDLEKLKAQFLSANAGQCGFCLSGILMTALAHLRDNPRPDRASVQLALRDHLCRCGAHNRIINAVLAAADG